MQTLAGETRCRLIKSVMRQICNRTRAFQMAISGKRTEDAAAAAAAAARARRGLLPI